MTDPYRELLNDLRESNLLEDSSEQGEAPVSGSEPAEAPDPHVAAVGSVQDELLFIGSDPDLGEERPDASTADSAEPADADLQVRPVKERRIADSDADAFAFGKAAVRNQMKKSAVDEVNALQTIDHVLSGVEREQQKVVSEPKDGLHVKQALHDLLQALEAVDAGAIAAAEETFVGETQKWRSELMSKDLRLLPADLRRHCESTRPALSGRALTELLLFYHSLPFSPLIREKYEIVVTRLYSRETGPGRRKALFGRELVAQQIATILGGHGDGGTAAAAAPVPDSALRAINGFDLLHREAEFADSFQDLVGDDFFRRLREAKESAGADTFVPEVAATLVELNVFVGNRFAELFEKEQRKTPVPELAARFGFVCEENVSRLVGQTMPSAERLCRSASKLTPSQTSIAAERKRRSRAGFIKRMRTMFTISPWLFAVLLVVVLSAVAIYFGTKQMILEGDESVAVKRVNLDSTTLKTFMTNARITGETFTATVTPEWNALDGEARADVVRKLQRIGVDKGFIYVRLTDALGATVAVGRPDGVEIKE